MSRSWDRIRERMLPHAPLWGGGAAIALAVVCVILLANVRGLRSAYASRLTESARVSPLAAQLREAVEEEAREPWLNWQERESELGALLEQAANRSGIFKPRLASIEPQQSRLLNRTLGERLILVRLQGVTLEELTKFLYETASPKGAPYQKELDMRRAADGSDAWDISLKLSLLFRVRETR